MYRSLVAEALSSRLHTVVINVTTQASEAYTIETRTGSRVGLVCLVRKVLGKTARS